MGAKTQSLEIWGQTATSDRREVVRRPPAPGGQSSAAVRLEKLHLEEKSHPATARSHAAVSLDFNAATAGQGAAARWRKAANPISPRSAPRLPYFEDLFLLQ